jgi:hypothetical protein
MRKRLLLLLAVFAVVFAPAQLDPAGPASSAELGAAMLAPTTGTDAPALSSTTRDSGTADQTNRTRSLAVLAVALVVLWCASAPAVRRHRHRWHRPPASYLAPLWRGPPTSVA